MTKLINCHKLKQSLEALDAPPFPGQLGVKIAEQISKPAWQLWLKHQTMLINEYRLNLLDPKSRTFLQTEMQKFLFGEGSEAPPGYSPTSKSTQRG